MPLTCPTSVYDRKFTGEYLKKSLVLVRKVQHSSVRGVVSGMSEGSHSWMINYNSGLGSPSADTADTAENGRTCSLRTAACAGWRPHHAMPQVSVD